MRPITTRTLRALGACPDQVDLFGRLYPKGVRRITTTTVRRALHEGLDVGWLLSRLSPTLWAEYERQHAPILAEYDRQISPLLAEYNRQRAPIWAEYDRQRAPIWAEYDRQRALLLAEYDRQHAPLLAEFLRRALREVSDA
jgi:hypothetical protein